MAFPSDPANSTKLDSSDTSAMLELFRAALGPLQTDYYLKTFTRFDANDRGGPSWNWAAALLTLNWMALRQLWGAALAYIGALLAAALLIFGIGRLVFQLSGEAQMVGLAGTVVLSLAIPGVFGNALLYNACRKRIEAALAANATLADACAMLSRQASGRQRLIGLGIGNAVVLVATACLALTMTNLAGFASRTDDGAAKSLGTITDASTSHSGVAPKLPPVAADKPAVVASAPVSGVSSMPAMPGSAASTPTSGSVPALASSAQSSGEKPPASPDIKAQAEPASSAEPPPQPVSQKTVQTKKLKVAPAKPSKATKVGSNAEAPYLVNVGLFADDNNARNAVAKLNDAGIPVISGVLETSKGKRTRVRAGPFATQAEAQRAADKIVFLGLEAVIVQQ